MTPQEIDDICLRVYRARLDDECDGDADRQVEKDKDDGSKQRRRSLMYRPVVVHTLIAIGAHVPAPRVAPVRRRQADEAVTP